MEGPAEAAVVRVVDIVLNVKFEEIQEILLDGHFVEEHSRQLDAEFPRSAAATRVVYCAKQVADGEGHVG